MAQTVKNLPAMQEIPGLGRSPAEEKSYPLQYSLPKEFHGQRSLEGYSPWGRQELDETERLSLSLFTVKGKGARRTPQHINGRVKLKLGYSVSY